MKGSPKRPLPAFVKWPGGLWAFTHHGTQYFASQDSGWWRVVAAHAEDTLLGPGGQTKEAAVRAALDTIDEQHQAVTPAA